MGVPWASSAADRLSQILVRRGRRQQIPGHLGRVSRRRQEAEGQGPSDRADARPYLRRRAGLHLPYLWSWGGKEVEADGKTVALNSKETIESVKFMQGFWKEACDEGGLAWDDTSNNRAFLSRTICGHPQRRLDLYRTQRKPDQYQTEKGTPMTSDILHAPLPKGPAGQFGLPSAAVQHADGIFEEPEGGQGVPPLGPHRGHLRASGSPRSRATHGVHAKWESDKLWDDDPVMLPFRIAAKPAGAGLRRPAERRRPPRC